MSTATHSGEARIATPFADRCEPRPVAAPGKIAASRFAAAYARIATRHLLQVLPQLRSELAHWGVYAQRIPDPDLRAGALLSLRKRGNIEGAALFATLAPRSERRRATRALVCFQTAYNYLDTLSELAGESRSRNARRLHLALLAALEPNAPRLDFYAHHPARDDGGYLDAILAACADALATLPSYPLVLPLLRRSAARIVDFQALNLTRSDDGGDPLRDWASELAPACGDLCWWEAAGAAGSSLAVHALIAAAADAELTLADAARLHDAYFPWVGGLHSQLDSLVDRDEDRADGQRSLVGCYGSTELAHGGLASLARRSRAALAGVPDDDAHRVILTAMCGYYLSARATGRGEARALARCLGGALGPALRVTLLVFGLRRLAAATAGERYV